MASTLDFLIRHGYAVLFAMSLIEQLGAPLPATPMLLAAGALSRTGQLAPLPALLLALLAALLGHTVWFEAGRRRGGQVLRIFCKLSLEPDSCVRRTEDLFAERGALTLVIAPWIPGLGGVAPPLAGMSGMPLWRFLALDAAANLVWAAAFIGLGYIFGNQLEAVLAIALRFGGWTLAAAVLALAAYLGIKLHQRRRLLRDLALSRISPGELKALLDAGQKLVIIDVRHAHEAAAGALPGALLVALDQLEAQAAAVPRDLEVVFYCS